MIHNSIDVTAWTVNDVLSWGKDVIGLNTAELEVLSIEDVNEKALIGLTYGMYYFSVHI